MTFQRIDSDKKRYLDLLLLADKQENMIDAYLERGALYILGADKAIAVCVVTDEGDGVLEIKNIAVYPAYQKKGYGKAMIDFIIQTYRPHYRQLQVGTGGTGIAFYEKCGFAQSHIIANFFTDHYDHPMYDEGIQLVDMVYLSRVL